MAGTHNCNFFVCIAWKTIEIFLGLGKSFPKKMFQIRNFPKQVLTWWALRPHPAPSDLRSKLFSSLNFCHQQIRISFCLNLIISIIFTLREHDRHWGHLPTKKTYLLQIYFFCFSIILFSSLLIHVTLVFIFIPGTYKYLETVGLLIVSITGIKAVSVTGYSFHNRLHCL